MISSRVPNRKRFNDYPVARSRDNTRSTVCLNLYKHGKDIVYSLLKNKVLRKIDYGSILLPVKDDDLVALEPVIAKNPGWMGVNIKLSIYKNRRGRYKGVYLWCKADLGICRIEPMFLTNYQYELQSIEDIKIEFKEDSVF